MNPYNLSPSHGLLDLIKGRKKFQNGTFDFFGTYLLMIVGNMMLNFQDKGGAMERRMRIIQADSIPTETLSLLDPKDTKYNGALVPELSGIFNWAYSMDHTEAWNFVKTNTLDNQQYSQINPMKQWILDETTQGKGSYIGLKPRAGLKDIMEAKRRRTPKAPIMNSGVRVVL